MLIMMLAMLMTKAGMKSDSVGCRKAALKVEGHQ